MENQYSEPMYESIMDAVERDAKEKSATICIDYDQGMVYCQIDAAYYEMRFFRQANGDEHYKRGGFSWKVSAA